MKKEIILAIDDHLTSFCHCLVIFLAILSVYIGVMKRLAKDPKKPLGLSYSTGGRI
jgi:uncharacterized membrane protein